MWSKIRSIAFIALSIWAVVSVLIIFRGNGELDGLRIRAQQIESDLREATGNLDTARLEAIRIGKELEIAYGRIGKLESRVIGYQKQIDDIIEGIGSARGDAREVGSLAIEGSGIVQRLQNGSGEKNSAP